MKVIKLDEKIFDGSDELDFLKLDCSIRFEDAKFRLKFDDFDEQSFDELIEKFSPIELETLVEKLNLKPYEFDGKFSYTDEGGLSLYYSYKIIDDYGNCLVVVSFGEKQPARYQIFVLGVLIQD